MGCIPTKGITPYYINFKKPENEAMKLKTIAYNKWYYKIHMNTNQRINIKSAYGFKGLFEILHIINDYFFTIPCDNIVGKKS